jgi:hypothetical protein
MGLRFSDMWQALTWEARGGLGNESEYVQGIDRITDVVLREGLSLS